MKINPFILSTILSVGLTLSISPSAQAAPVKRDAVQDMRSNVVRDTAGNCVRTKWLSDGDECQKATKAVPHQKYAQIEIPDEERTIYFEFNKTRLVDTAKAKLDSLAHTLKSSDDITGVSIVGYADRIGTNSYNDNLSKQRAQVVENALRERGYLNTTIAKTRWLGESGPITNCEDSLKRIALIDCLQQDRRVTVEINYEDEELYPTN